MSRSLLTFAWISALLVVFGPAPAPAAALCAGREFVLSLRGHVAGTRPAAAGLVVVRSDVSVRGAEIADLDAVRFVGAGQTPFPLVSEEVATGVWVLRPSTPLVPGHYELRGVSSRPMPVELTATPVLPPSTPRVRGLVRRPGLPDLGEIGAPATRSSMLEAQLAGALPSGALLIAQWQEGTEAASTWGLIGGTAAHPTAIVATRARCGGDGRFPRRGSRVTFRTLDLFGQLSEPSAPVRAP